jgi:hypothetical protein
MSIDYWNFEGDTTVIVDHLASETWNRVLGESEQARLVFRPAGRATGHEDRAEAVQAYGQYAGTDVVDRTDGGGVYVRESVAAAAPVDSHLVRLRPSPTQVGTQFEGIWGLVRSVESPNRLTNRIELTMELTYLGDASEYADRAAVESALTQSVI